MQIRRGSWHTLSTVNFAIHQNGSAVAFLVHAAPGFAYRVKNVFIGDADHLGDTSAWQYFKVT